jgi:hypothetical protein
MKLIFTILTKLFRGYIYCGWVQQYSEARWKRSGGYANKGKPKRSRENQSAQNHAQSMSFEAHEVVINFYSQPICWLQRSKAQEIKNAIGHTTTM